MGCNQPKQGEVFVDIRATGQRGQKKLEWKKEQVVDEGHNKKTHIVWNVEETIAKQQPEGEDAKEAEEEAEQKGGEKPGLASEIEELGEPVPAFEDGQVVEYFSTSYMNWLCGRVRVQIRQDVGGDDMSRKVAYHVLAQNTWRTHVPLDKLRRPFEQKERALLFVRRQAQWLPAIVTGPQHLSPFGYTVEVVLKPGSAPQELKNVPGLCLRRSYPVKGPVEVYRGPSRGWVPSTVLEEIDDPEMLRRFKDRFTEPTHLTRHRRSKEEDLKSEAPISEAPQRVTGPPALEQPEESGGKKGIDKAMTRGTVGTVHVWVEDGVEHHDNDLGKTDHLWPLLRVREAIPGVKRNKQLVDKVPMYLVRHRERFLV
mmetsp:Transcript_87535/g.203615  ORF Transcript_87535/g.203615 Transcript_87535/m.203615 type:complete len:369 (+) Transcript_87535:86-1192(+)